MFFFNILKTYLDRKALKTTNLFWVDMIKKFPIWKKPILLYMYVPYALEHNFLYVNVHVCRICMSQYLSLRKFMQEQQLVLGLSRATGTVRVI